MSARALGVAIALAVLLAFGAARDFGFVAWDDGLHFEQNPHLNPVTAEGLRALWTAPYERIYTPLPYTFWAGLARGAEALGAPGAGARDHSRLFHRANLVLHALNALLVFAVLRVLLRARSQEGVRGEQGAGPVGDERALDLACAAGAGLFALHPLQTEAVAWASGARDLLYAMLCLLALRLQLAAGSGVGVARAAAWAAATPCFALALFAKPNAAALPAVVLVLEAGVLRRRVGRTLLRLAPWLLLALLFAWIASRIQPLRDALPAPLWARPLLAADTLAFYLGKVAWPAELGIDYGRSLLSLSRQPARLWSGVVPLALALLAWLGRRRWPGLGWGLAVFAAGLLPALGLVPYRFQLLSTVADRYVYLALLGPALALAWLLAGAAARPAWPRTPRGVAPFAAGALLLLALGAQAARQTASWSSSRGLFEQALRANPKSVIGHAGLADLHLADEDWDAAIQHYRRALAVVPRIPTALNRLGYALLRQGRAEEAIPVLERALRDRPDSVEVHGNLAEAWLARGDPARARAHLERARALAPDHPLVRERLDALAGP